NICYINKERLIRFYHRVALHGYGERVYLLARGNNLISQRLRNIVAVGGDSSIVMSCDIERDIRCRSGRRKTNSESCRRRTGVAFGDRDVIDIQTWRRTRKAIINRRTAVTREGSRYKKVCCIVVRIGATTCFAEVGGGVTWRRRATQTFKAICGSSVTDKISDADGERTSVSAQGRSAGNQRNLAGRRCHRDRAGCIRCWQRRAVGSAA